MKNRLLLVILLGCLVLGLVGCGSSSDNSKEPSNNSLTLDDSEKVSEQVFEGNNESGELSIETLSKMKETSKDEFVYFSYEGVAYITEFIGNSECVVIPNEIDGNLVVEISNTAFRNNTNVKAVKIGDNVKKVGDYVFANCSALEFVLLSDSVESLGEGAFVGCANVKEIRLNEGLLTIGNLAICETEVPTVIPRSVIEIGRNALSQPLKVYKGSYAETYIVDYANNYGAEFVYEIIE